MGSGITLLDGTVVNVALRTIGEDLDASLAELQWINNGYLLTLASLILLGGALGGPVRASAPLLRRHRLVRRGVAAVRDRAPAIGAWSGPGGIAAALGPLLGGALIDAASWRWIFLVNLPLAVVSVWIALRHVPESRSPTPAARCDVVGAGLAMVALGGVTYALIQWGVWQRPLPASSVWSPAAAFLVVESRVPEPMMPLGLFADRVFSAANAMTLVVYAALGAVLFFLVLQLQTVVGYVALEAGVATLPITLCMLFLASPGGRLGARIGPRMPMTVGPILMGLSVALLLRVDRDASYWIDVLPGLTGLRHRAGADGGPAHRWPRCPTGRPASPAASTTRSRAPARCSRLPLSRRWPD